MSEDAKPEDTTTSAPTGNRQRGIVAKWLNHRGIGFVTPDGQDAEIGKDFLVHYSNIKQEPNDEEVRASLEASEVRKAEMASEMAQPVA